MSNIKISVITCSIRPDGLKILQECLKSQTFKDFEWVVELGLGLTHDLNAAYNRAVKRSSGELVVSVQDYLKVPPNYLQKFWDSYQKYPNTFLTAPVGKVKNKDYSGEVKWDWRSWQKIKNGTDDTWESDWNTWEIDSGACPREALFKIGGFDEELDKYWSCDNVNVGCRAGLSGYKFRNCFYNPSLAYDHDAFETHPFRDKFHPSFNNDRMDEFRQGLKINYLT